MRQIKYRAKKTQDGTWVYGTPLLQYHSSRYGRIDAMFYSDDEKTHRVPIDASTLGQCLFVNDKNDKEIYEGDIVKLLSEGLAVVTYCHEGMMWLLDNQYGGFGWGHKDAEVVGNIHDNPNLVIIPKSDVNRLP